MSDVHQKKAKLRPARDIISRLRWSSESPAINQVVFGYIDRINGTMEKAVEDYIPMADGGDIPEHRILYFRHATDEDNNNGSVHNNLSNNIIWDRAGRVDRVFESGYFNKDVSKETIEEAMAAINTMARLEQEKAERREQKARDRARRTRARAAERKSVAVVSEHHIDGSAADRSGVRDRFQWKQIPWHQFDENTQQWKHGEYSGGKKKNEETASLSVLTWNVLSNIYPGIDGVNGNSGIDGHTFRWSRLAEAIHEQSPDIIALQEATPDFAEQLLAIDWIRLKYASSLSPLDKSPVNPIGQILLWKHSNIEASALHACVDGVRWRALSADFRFGRENALLCANVHLPADKNSTKGGEKVSRQLARRRELSSVIGHMQTVESQLKRIEPQAEMNHLILGDFNCAATDLDDGSFTGGGYFEDIWSKIHSGSSENTSGYTFCPETNQRAASNSSSMNGRRIDRMYLNTKAEMEIVQARVVRGATGADNIPPSDHYGVFARFLARESNGRTKCMSECAALYNCSQLNAWAANVPPSKDFMVAIILDNEDMEQLKLTYDAASSLLRPHISLLYGFAEMHQGGVQLATRAIKDSIISVFREQSSSPRTMLSFSAESLDVFEHRSSATLVARPDVQCDGNKWLMQLYDALGSRFRLCNNQEMHSVEGYAPHVSLGKFGFTSAARKAGAEHNGTISDLNISVRSVDILERGANGKFRSITTVPFSSPPNKLLRGLEHIIPDTGREASSYFSEKSQLVRSIINQASRSAAASFEMNVTSNVITYGSVALDCALPKMSDLDMVVMIRPSHGNISNSELIALVDENCLFLKRLMASLSETHTVSKMRLRQLRSGLSVLSIQVQPDLPMADVLMCLLGHDGKQIGIKTDEALYSIQDNAYLTLVLEDIERKVGGSSDSYSMKDVFCASLRLIKLWAFNRGVYGANCGFLGGGAWAIFLAKIMKEMLVSDGNRPILVKTKSLQEAAHRLTLAFFEEASRWPWPQHVTLNSNNGDEQLAQLQPRLVVLSPSSASNLGRNSTMSTCLSTAAELRRASTLVKGIVGNRGKPTHIGTLRSIIAPLGLQELIASSPDVITLELVYESKESLSPSQLPEDIHAWGCGQYLSFLVNLEKKLDDLSLLRPLSRPLKVQLEWKIISTNVADINQDGFVWIIGISRVLSKEEHEIVKDVSSRLAHCFGESMHTRGLHISAKILSSEIATERIIA